uniref:PEST proteolytic signal containing nuclear protein n=1 Tax=Gorilla gorilla gorilla TaxID=9595 RepID=A0A2I2YN77_GORGO
MADGKAGEEKPEKSQRAGAVGVNSWEPLLLPHNLSSCCIL